jgi:glyoxylase-like metal-dependent hydrolase (beta-lactamase superfamily II)
MILRPFFYEPTSCASYLFGCTTHGQLAVVDPHEALVDDYCRAAREIGSPIVAVFDTHVQADHVSGLPGLVEAGAIAYLPEGADVDFEHVALADGRRIELGNTVVTALATPGHAPAHAAFVVADRRRGDEAPWLVFTGDSLLVNDVGRPDLHAGRGDPGPLARILHRSLRRLLELPDGVVVLPSHYGGSVCGKSLSGNPISTIGFERGHNRALALDEDTFVAESLRDLPPAPADQAAIVAANRSGHVHAAA